MCNNQNWYVWVWFYQIGAMVIKQPTDCVTLSDSDSVVARLIYAYKHVTSVLKYILVNLK